MKSKLLKNPDIDEILKISRIFNLESPIKISEYKNIIVFYNDNDELIGFVNYVENHYLNFTKSFINMIYFVENTYLDSMIKRMIEQMKQKGYSYIILDTDLFDGYIIDVIKSNNFVGDDYLSFSL
jgi:hypothetical protein